MTEVHYEGYAERSLRGLRRSALGVKSSGYRGRFEAGTRVGRSNGRGGGRWGSTGLG